jgi:YfiH family protein
MPSNELVESRLSFAVQFGFAIEKKGETPSLIKQVHGKIALPLSPSASDAPPEADAVFTSQANVGVWVFTADCLPVILAGGDSLAVVHAGWRGAKLGVVAEAIQKAGMENKIVHAIFGPSLLACCFEVKEDFIEDFSQARGNIDRYLSKRESKNYFDLIAFVQENEFTKTSQVQFHQAHSRCTLCSNPPLPSYRRNKIADPRIRTWAVKKQNDQL